MTTFEPTWESLKQFVTPDWYQDAKFGIFIHWGVYAVPAFDNEWYPRNMYIQGSRAFEHHVATFGKHTNFGYKDFIPQFKAEQFDADAWMRLFKQAGARYVVPVAEHHDGFAMYDTALSRWSAAKMGPKRDVIGELAAAARKAGITFGLSSHRAEHWWFLNGGRQFDSDINDAAYADLYGPARLEANGSVGADSMDSLDFQPRPDAKFLDDWLARCTELVDKYQPQLFYFDWWIQQIAFSAYVQKFAAYYYNRGEDWGKQVAINCKNVAYPDGTVVFDIERGQSGAMRPDFWQSDTSVATNSWCYTTENTYRSSASIVHDLIDIVSKNGTLLLNIGPRADGVIDERDASILRDMGRWLDVYGEAIYGTRTWKIYGEGPTDVIGGGFTDRKRADFTFKDVRFTTKGDALYAILLGVPEDGEAVIEALGKARSLYEGEIASVELVGAGAVEWSREDEGLQVKLPSVGESPAVALRIR